MKPTRCETCYYPQASFGVPWPAACRAIAMRIEAPQPPWIGLLKRLDPILEEFARYGILLLRHNPDPGQPEITIGFEDLEQYAGWAWGPNGKCSYSGRVVLSTRVARHWPTQMTIVMHELGHAIGLPHHNGSDSIMSPITAGRRLTFEGDPIEPQLVMMYGPRQRDSIPEPEPERPDPEDLPGVGTKRYKRALEWIRDHGEGWSQQVAEQGLAKEG